MTETDGAEQLNRFVADIDASNEITARLNKLKTIISLKTQMLRRALL